MTVEKSERVYVAKKHYIMYGAFVKYLSKKKIDNNFTKRELMELLYYDEAVDMKLHKSNHVQSFLELLCRFGIATEESRDCYAIKCLEDTLDKPVPKNKSNKPALKDTLDKQTTLFAIPAEVRKSLRAMDR